MRDTGQHRWQTPGLVCVDNLKPGSEIMCFTHHRFHRKRLIYSNDIIIWLAQLHNMMATIPEQLGMPCGLASQGLVGLVGECQTPLHGSIAHLRLQEAAQERSNSHPNEVASVQANNHTNPEIDDRAPGHRHTSDAKEGTSVHSSPPNCPLNNDPRKTVQPGSEHSFPTYPHQHPHPFLPTHGTHFPGEQVQVRSSSAGLLQHVFLVCNQCARQQHTR